jgi:anti-sigma regulatory factor (Ser/Thr protein kinase)
MIKYKPIVRYDSFNNIIRIPSKVGSNIIADFAAAIKLWQQKRPDDVLTLDFSSVEHPYTNGMLPIIATITELRAKNLKIKIKLPFNPKIKNLFNATNWSYFLDPQKNTKSEATHDRHLVTRQFTDDKEVANIIRDFMDVVLRNMSIPKDIISALEWSVNEICDNVLNHSESQFGGFVQLTTFVKNDVISFGVADAGRGILNSLKEGIPTLQTDLQAIGEAIKAGVTRNKEAGQGNGLAGSLRITTMTGGSLDIISGTGRFLATNDDNKKKDGNKNQSYMGTNVSGQINMSKKFSIADALNFGGPFPYTAFNIIDQDYEMKDQNSLLMTMRDETTGLGTRNAGRQLKTKILNLIESKPGFPIFVDWAGVPVISSSFADEFMGKLFLELGPLNFGKLIRNLDMESIVRQLLDKAILQRLAQSKDSED